MTDSYQYTMLICSLPHHGRSFVQKRPPLSRLRLDRRLQMLTEADAARLDEIERLAQWDYLSHQESDLEIVRYAQGFIPGLAEPALRAILDDRLTLRTLVAGLRRRLLGDPPPRLGEPWGYGPWLDMMVRHWSHPAFGLERPFPWLEQADGLLRAGDSLGLERLLLGLSWRHLNRLSAGHDFDFVAVVVYVLKWQLVDRWSRFDAGVAIERFEGLINEGLGRYQGALFSGGANP